MCSLVLVTDGVEPSPPQKAENSRVNTNSRITRTVSQWEGNLTQFPLDLTNLSDVLFQHMHDPYKRHTVRNDRALQ